MQELQKKKILDKISQLYVWFQYNNSQFTNNKYSHLLLFLSIKQIYFDFFKSSSVSVAYECK
jgi:hypothetical protein